MKQKAIILPSWHSSPKDNWYPWVSAELTRLGFDPFIPDLPTINSDLPELEKMISALLFSGAIDRQMMIIGHSLGCLTALRLAERMPYRKMILISGWDFNDLTAEHRFFWQKPLDHAKIIRNVTDITCVTSDNDPYITAFQVEEMSKRLHAKYLLIKGAGHFGSKDNKTEIPELVSYLT